MSKVLFCLLLKHTFVGKIAKGTVGRLALNLYFEALRFYPLISGVVSTQFCSHLVH